MTDKYSGFYQNQNYISRSSSNFETNLYTNQEHLTNSNQKNNFKKINSSSKKQYVLDERNSNNYYNCTGNNEKYDAHNKISSNRSINKENKFDTMHSGTKPKNTCFGDYFPMNNKSEYYMESNQKQGKYIHNEDNISNNPQSYRSNAQQSVKITDRHSLYNNDPTDTSYDSKNPSCSNAGYTNMSEKPENQKMKKKDKGSPRINRKINNQPTQNTNKKMRESSLSSPRESHYPMSSYRNQQNFYYETEEEGMPNNNTTITQNSVRDDQSHKKYNMSNSRSHNLQKSQMMSPKTFNVTYINDLDHDFASYEEDLKCRQMLQIEMQDRQKDYEHIMSSQKENKEIIREKQNTLLQELDLLGGQLDSDGNLDSFLNIRINIQSPELNLNSKKMFHKLESIQQMITSSSTKDELRFQIIELSKVHTERDEKINEICVQISQLRTTNERHGMLNEDKLSRKMQNEEFMVMSEYIEESQQNTQKEMDNKILLCTNYETYNRRSKEIQERIEFLNNKLSQEQSLKKQVQTELIIADRHIPAMNVHVKTADKEYSDFVEEYFDKFHHNMKEVQTYFDQKAENSDADEKSVSTFFDIMTIFEIKYHAELDFFQYEISELEAIKDMVMNAGEYVLAIVNENNEMDCMNRLIALGTCIEKFKTNNPKYFNQDENLESSGDNFYEKTKNLFESFEKCGKKLKPQYNNLFNENLYNSQIMQDKIDVRKNLFRSFVSSQKKFLSILYSHIIKRHNYNTEYIKLMETVEILETTNSKFTEDHLQSTNELTELNAESSILQNNIGALLNQFNHQQIISNQENQNFESGFGSNFDVTNLLTSMNSVSESCDFYGDSNTSKSMNFKELVNDVNKNIIMKKNQNTNIENEEDFRCSIEGKTFSKDNNENQHGVEQRHTDLRQNKTELDKFVSGTELNFSQHENIGVSTNVMTQENGSDLFAYNMSKNFNGNSNKIEKLKYEKETKVGCLIQNVNFVNQIIDKNNYEINNHLTKVIGLYEKECHEINVLLKVNRQFLLSNLMSENKVQKAIGNILDYVNKPILCRDLGAFNMDYFHGELCELRKQVNYEINKQKQLLQSEKTLSSHEVSKKNPNESMCTEKDYMQDRFMANSITQIKDELNDLNVKQIPCLKMLEEETNVKEQEILEKNDILNNLIQRIQYRQYDIGNRLKEWYSNTEINLKDYINSKKKNFKNLRHEQNFLNCCFEIHESLTGEADEWQKMNTNRNKTFDNTLKLSNYEQNKYISEATNQNYVDFMKTQYNKKRTISSEMTCNTSQKEVFQNDQIIQKMPKSLFARILEAFDQGFGLYRTNCLNKVSQGMIIFKKLAVSTGIRLDKKNFDPLQYFENQTRKNFKGSLESYSFNNRLIQFDFQNSEINFFVNKKLNRRKNNLSQGKSLRSCSRNNESYNLESSCITSENLYENTLNEDDEEITASRWVLESRYELRALKEIVLPEITKKMIKSRLSKYAPSQYNVYNQRELQMLRECNYFVFDLEIRDVGMIQCLVDDQSIFLDIYCAINFLKL